MYSKDVILVLLASFFYMASAMLTMPIIAGFAGFLGATATWMGIIAGAMNLISFVCHPIVGHIIDTHSKYKLTIIGALFLAIASIGYMLTSSPIILCLFRFVNGIGFACCSISLSTWLADLIPKNKIGSGMGLYGMMNAIAMAVAPALGLFCYQYTSYMGVFIVALIFSLAIILVAYNTNNKDNPKHKTTQQITTKTWRIVNINIIPLACIIMLFAIPYCATQAFIVTYIETQHIFANAGLFFPMYAGILFIIRLLLKPLFDTIAFFYFLLCSSICAIIALLCFANLNGNILLIIAAIGMAGSYGIMSSVCQANAIERVAFNDRGVANSTYYLGIDLGMALGPIIGGLIYNNFSLTYFYPLFFITIPLIWIVYTWDYYLQKARK